MAERTSRDAERLYSLVPEDGTAIGNKTLREKLKWGKEKYLEVRQELLNDGWLRLGHGRGGSVRRVDGEAQQLLAKVPSDGTPVSNARLRRELGWKDDQYWRVRNELIDLGILIRGGGTGGSVYRFIEDGDADEENEEDASNDDEVSPRRATNHIYEREADLYAPIKRILEKDWAKDQGLDAFFVEITAHKRKRSNVGRWSHPDLAVIGDRRFKHTGQRVFDIFTFEVKFSGAWDITAIYEALAHGRCATYSYAFFYYVNLDANSERILESCTKEAQRHGVGLILTNDPSSYEAWEIKVEPRRSNPDPADMERFIATQIPEERHRVMRKWSR